MLCSLKRYKGIYEFIEIATHLPQYPFDLVINATQAQIEEEFKELHLPQNLQIYPSQSNVHPFYRQAKVVINLSHPDGWIETFGLTILEGMSYGLPVIVPYIGG